MSSGETLQWFNAPEPGPSVQEKLDKILLLLEKDKRLADVARAFVNAWLHDQAHEAGELIKQMVAMTRFIDG